MNALSRARLFVIVVALLLSVALVTPLLAQDTMSDTLRVATTHVETHPSQGDVRQIEGATSMLMATEAGVSLHMVTNELENNHVYTMWVVIVNNPDACEASPCTPPEILGNSDGLQSVWLGGTD